jgi:hypothetical protein
MTSSNPLRVKADLTSWATRRVCPSGRTCARERWMSHSADQRQDGLEDQARVHRTIKAPSSGRIGFYNEDSGDTETPVPSYS